MTARTLASQDPTVCAGSGLTRHRFDWLGRPDPTSEAMYTRRDYFGIVTANILLTEYVH